MIHRLRIFLLLTAGLLLAEAGCRMLPSAADAPPLLPLPSTSLRSDAVAAVLKVGPTVLRVTPGGVTITGRPVDTLLGKAVTVTVTPENAEALAFALPGEETRDGFAVRAEGLPANRVCNYTVKIGGATVGPFHFVTAVPPGDDAEFRFAVIGDTQNHGIWRSLSEKMLEWQPRFFLHLGDHVSTGGSAAFWGPNFFDPGRPLLAHVPIVPVHGNHDDANGVYLEKLDVPNYWHTFDYGCVRIINVASFVPWAEGTEQYQWLVKELARKWDGWLICAMHAPPYSIASDASLNFAWIEKICPMLVESGVDILFSGHDHLYMRSKPIAFSERQRGMIQVISGGGGGSRDGARADIPHVVKNVSLWHYLVIDANPKSLNCRMIPPEGNVFDEFTLVKDAPQPDLILSPRKAGEPWRYPQTEEQHAP